MVARMRMITMTVTTSSKVKATCLKPRDRAKAFTTIPIPRINEAPLQQRPELRQSRGDLPGARHGVFGLHKRHRFTAADGHENKRVDNGFPFQSRRIPVGKS